VALTSAPKSSKVRAIGVWPSDAASTTGMQPPSAAAEATAP
jgi:hypothetical protein